MSPNTVVQRRTLIGGFVGLFAVAAAPTIITLAHDKAVTLSMVIESEEWLPYPWWGVGHESEWLWCYRVLARHGDRYAYGTGMLHRGGVRDLNVRENVRADARWLLRQHFRNGHGWVK